MTHIIRLHGPWQYEILSVSRQDPTIDQAGLPTTGRIKMPADWGETLGRDFRGRVRYTRRFGRPTGLEAGDRVRLVVQRLDALGSITLNDGPPSTLLPGQRNWQHDVTTLLEPRNLLTIEVELPEEAEEEADLKRPDRIGQPGGIIGSVRLEIDQAE